MAVDAEVSSYYHDAAAAAQVQLFPFLTLTNVHKQTSQSAYTCQPQFIGQYVQEGFRRLHSTQRQEPSLHWAIQDAAELCETHFCCYLDFANAFNRVDHTALWR